MIKCIECGKEIVDGGPRYATPDGSFCCDCWEKKDQKFILGTHESLRERCIMCGKPVHPSRLTRVYGKYGGAPDKLCPDCLKEYKLKKAEEATQIHIADLSIENNRLRTKLKDLEEAHSDLLDRCYWGFWIMLGLGVAAGIIFSNIFK